MTNLANITSGVTALSGLILVSPQSTTGYQPLNPKLPDGSVFSAPQPKTFVFHYEGEQTVGLESDITDHYVEDNTAVQDQISLKPETISTQGFIGELNDVPPAALAALKFAANKLTLVGGYTPRLTTTALIAYSEALFLYQTAANAVNSAISTVESIGNVFGANNGQNVIGSGGLTEGGTQNEQQKAFQKFYTYWHTRTLFNIQTPWAVFQNMAITKLRAVQDAETNAITTFEVSFKMIRVASTLSFGAQALGSYQGRSETQNAGDVNNGTSAPENDLSLGDGTSSMEATG